MLIRIIENFLLWKFKILWLDLMGSPGPTEMGT